jgi:hypothetical protein
VLGRNGEITTRDVRTFDRAGGQVKHARRTLEGNVLPSRSSLDMTGLQEGYSEDGNQEQDRTANVSDFLRKAHLEEPPGENVG